MASKYLIGLDIGTSGAKCILVDDKGAVLASSTQEYPLSTPKPGWAEQDPQDWWDAVGARPEGHPPQGQRAQGPDRRRQLFRPDARPGGAG